MTRWKEIIVNIVKIRYGDYRKRSLAQIRVANYSEYFYTLWMNLTETLLKYQNNTKTYLQENSYRFLIILQNLRL